MGLLVSDAFLSFTQKGHLGLSERSLAKWKRRIAG